VLRLSVVQAEKKVATLRNKIALHENFMMVQPIAAGTQQTEVKWCGMGDRESLTIRL
jgi:predicted ATPase